MITKVVLCVKVLALYMYTPHIGEPSLAAWNLPIRYPEGMELSVSLEVGHSAHPFPSEFQWTVPQGVVAENDTRRRFGYPGLSFSSVRRSDSGVYSLTATNRFLEEPMDVFGTGMGNFTLEVLCESLCLQLNCCKK